MELTEQAIIERTLPASYFDNVPGVGDVVDYYSIDDLLTEEERHLRDRVRAFCNREVIPIIAQYWEQGQFPFKLVPRMAELGIAGGTIQGYGCPGMGYVGLGLMSAELARGDGGLNIFLGVHSVLAMAAIHTFGTEEQKAYWLPPMARMEKIGAFGSTEAMHGSDVMLMETHARRDGNGWVLNGSKRWIGNASFADVVVVWAKTEQGTISAFLVEKGTPGFTADVIQGKVAVRTSWQANIRLDNVYVPAENHLSKIRSMNDLFSILNASRYGLAWAAVGHSMACYEYALAYARHRKQFGKPLASFQLIQQKLVHMLAEITSMQLLCWRLGKLFENGKVTIGKVSMAKMITTTKGRQIAADARDILGGNGILIENHVAKHMADMEIPFTVEGTDHIQTLIVGREITGLQAIL